MTGAIVSISTNTQNGAKQETNIPESLWTCMWIHDIPCAASSQFGPLTTNEVGSSPEIARVSGPSRTCMATGRHTGLPALLTIVLLYPNKTQALKRRGPTGQSNAKLVNANPCQQKSRSKTENLSRNTCFKRHLQQPTTRQDNPDTVFKADTASEEAQFDNSDRFAPLGGATASQTEPNTAK